MKHFSEKLFDDQMIFHAISGIAASRPKSTEVLVKYIVELSGSGSWTVPAGVTKIKHAFLVGGGGGGGSAEGSSQTPGTGGSGGGGDGSNSTSAGSGVAKTGGGGGGSGISIAAGSGGSGTIVLIFYGP